MRHCLQRKGKEKNTAISVLAQSVSSGSGLVRGRSCHSDMTSGALNIRNILCLFQLPRPCHRTPSFFPGEASLLAFSLLIDLYVCPPLRCQLLLLLLVTFFSMVDPSACLQCRASLQSFKPMPVHRNAPGYPPTVLCKQAVSACCSLSYFVTQRFPYSFQPECPSQGGPLLKSLVYTGHLLPLPQMMFNPFYISF